MSRHTAVLIMCALLGQLVALRRLCSQIQQMSRLLLTRFPSKTHILVLTGSGFSVPVLEEEWMPLLDQLEGNWT